MPEIGDRKTVHRKITVRFGACTVLKIRPETTRYKTVQVLDYGFCTVLQHVVFKRKMRTVKLYPFRVTPTFTVRSVYPWYWAGPKARFPDSGKNGHKNQKL